MPFVVTENCIKCKYTDCVEVCPVDCFHEGPNFLVIDPEECIDCTLCEPECPAEAIMPDIVVRQSVDGAWLVELNPDTLPRVLVNQSYFASVSKTGNDHAFLSECLQNANWLTRSLDQRAKTMMKVASEIVRQQDAFLLHCVDHLRPLNLKTVADAIKMHESTVSRVTSNKYLLCDRGLLELKYFFGSGVASAAGDGAAAEAVKAGIREVIDAETEIRASVEYAFAHPEASRDYVRSLSHEMSDEVCAAHIPLYVNEHSVDVGDEGLAAIDRLLGRATAAA